MSVLTRMTGRLAAAVVLVALAAAPAHTQITIFTAALNGANERPTSNLSPAIGFATVTLNEALSTLLVDESFSGLIGGVATGAHIHCCASTAGTGPVAVDFGPNGFPLGVTGGAYSHLFDLLNPISYSPAFITLHGSVANARNVVVAGMLAGNTYANIHNAQFPAGEIRGQLVAVVPEPATVGLLALGLIGIAGMAARRRV